MVAADVSNKLGSLGLKMHLFNHQTHRKSFVHQSHINFNPVYLNLYNIPTKSALHLTEVQGGFGGSVIKGEESIRRLPDKATPSEAKQPPLREVDILSRNRENLTNAFARGWKDTLVRNKSPRLTGLLTLPGEDWSPPGKKIKKYL